MVTKTKLIDYKSVSGKAFAHGRWFQRCEVVSKNELTRSNELDDSDWTKSACSILADMMTVPYDGYAIGTVLYADKIVEDGTTASHYIVQAFTTTGSTTYTMSAFVKAGERHWARFAFTNGFPINVTIWFDLENGVVGPTMTGVESYGIEEVCNGWYLCWVTSTSDASPVSTSFRINVATDDGVSSYAGDGSSGIYVWQVQLEAKSFPTSPIETLSSAITRTGENLYIPEADVPDAVRGPFTIYWLPPCDSSAHNVVCGIFYFNDSTETIQLQINAAEIPTLIGSVQGYYNSGALAYSRYQLIAFTIEPAWGCVTIKGSNQNNGTLIGFTWSTSDGNVYIGRLNTAFHAGYVTLPCERDPNALQHLFEFDDGTFENDCVRYLTYDEEITKFEINIPAIATIDYEEFIQIEKEVTNLLTYSSQFDKAYPNWVRYHTEVHANIINSPDNTNTADKLIIDSTLFGTHYIQHNITPDGASQYCFSVYAKAAEKTWVRLYNSSQGFPGTVVVYYDLINGIVGTVSGSPDTTGIENVGNGWFRCWYSVTSDNPITTGFFIYIAEADSDVNIIGDGYSGIYIWNAQVEIGTAPTSPIITGSSTETRSGDNFVLASDKYKSFIRTSKHAIRWIPNYSSDEILEDSYFYFFDDVSSGLQLRLQISTAGVVSVWRNNSGWAMLSDTTALTFSKRQKMSIYCNPASASNNLIVFGGTSGGANNSSTAWNTFIPTTSDLYLGSDNANAHQVNSLLSKIIKIDFT